MAWLIVRLAQATELGVLLAAAVPLQASGAEPVACAQRIEATAQRVAAVTDLQTRAILDNDLRHARKEAGEGDEKECMEILDHADKVLNQTQ